MLKLPLYALANCLPLGKFINICLLVEFTNIRLNVTPIATSHLFACFFLEA